MERPAPLDRLLTPIFLSHSLSLSRSVRSYANRLCLAVKTKRRGSEREEETKERFEPPGNNPSPLSLPFDRPRRCPPFLLLLLLLSFRRFSFCTRHQRRRATSTRSAISRRRPNRPLLLSRSLRPPLPWRARYEVVSRIPSKTRPRHSASGLHYHRESC